MKEAVEKSKPNPQPMILLMSKRKKGGTRQGRRPQKKRANGTVGISAEEWRVLGSQAKAPLDAELVIKLANGMCYWYDAAEVEEVLKNKDCQR